MVVKRLIIPMLILLGALASGCGGDDKNPTNPGTGTADVTIQIVGNLGDQSYSPDTTTVTVGQTVSWHNADVMAHTATSNTTGTGSFGTGTLNAGQTSLPTAMNTQGTFAYHCTLHAGMTGVLKVQ